MNWQRSQAKKWKARVCSWASVVAVLLIPTRGKQPSLWDPHGASSLPSETHTGPAAFPLRPTCAILLRQSWGNGPRTGGFGLRCYCNESEEKVSEGDSRWGKVRISVETEGRREWDLTWILNVENTCNCIDIYRLQYYKYLLSFVDIKNSSRSIFVNKK